MDLNNKQKQMSELPEWLQKLWQISPMLARQAENDYINLKKQLSIQRVVFNEAEIDEDIIVNVPHKSLGKYSIKKIEDSEVELCECNWPLIRTGTKERPEYCGNCEKDI